MSGYILERTRDGEVLYDIYSRLVKDRIVFVSGEDGIDNDVATTIAATLLFLDNQTKNKPIYLYLNSPGGTVSSGLFTIYDTMNYVKSPIYTVCIGEACSSAAVLLAAGAPGNRMSFPNSMIMIHEVQTAKCNMESNSSLLKRSKLTDKINKQLVDTLAKHTKKPAKKIEELMKEETYFTAEEAKEFGIIDKIVTSK